MIHFRSGLKTLSDHCSLRLPRRLGTLLAQLSLHSELVIELKALGEEIGYCCLALGDVAANLEFAVGAHVVD